MTKYKELLTSDKLAESIDDTIDKLENEFYIKKVFYDEDGNKYTSIWDENIKNIDRYYVNKSKWQNLSNM
jgi:hypothetical protein